MSANARLESGEMNSIQTKQIVQWRRESGGAELEATRWRIYGWHTENFHTIDAGKVAFAEVLDAAITVLADLERARISIHENIVTNAILDPESFVPPDKFFSIPPFDRHPGGLRVRPGSVWS